MSVRTHARWCTWSTTVLALGLTCVVGARPARAEPSANPTLWPHDVPQDVVNRDAIKALKPGMTIDKTNWELVKDLLPPRALEAIKNGQRTITIATGHHHTPGTENYQAETQKNLTRVKLNPDGTLQGWVGGLAFPQVEPTDPQAGLKVMWNWQTRPIGDDRWMHAFHFVQTRDGHEIKSFGVKDTTATRPGWGSLNWINRTDVSPIPEIANNPDKIFQTSMITLSYPYDQADTVILLIRYQQALTDPDYHKNKGDDEYAYVPSVRRVRRVSNAQRTDSFGGSDITFDDIDGYTGTVLENTYKFIDREFQLLQVAEGPEYEKKFNDHTLYTPTPSLNLPYELRLTYKVEVKNKNSEYIYSKRIMWIDNEAWQVNGQELYDRAGKHWKSFSLTGEATSSTKGKGMTLYTGGSLMYDLENNTATMTMVTQGSQGYNIGMTPETYAIQNLRKQGK